MTPDYSVLWRDRLVAYVWKSEAGGKLRRSSKELCDVPWAEIQLFDAAKEKLLVQLIHTSADLDAFLFELGLEELQVRPGAVKPNLGSRSF